MISCYSVLTSDLQEIIGFSCSWCGDSYHPGCFSTQLKHEPCHLGPLRNLVIPPSWIVKIPPIERVRVHVYVCVCVCVCVCMHMCVCVCVCNIHVHAGAQSREHVTTLDGEILISNIAIITG